MSEIEKILPIDRALDKITEGKVREVVIIGREREVKYL